MKNPSPRPRLRPRQAASATPGAAAVAATGTTFVTSDFQDLPATVSWPRNAPLDIVLPDLELGRLSPCMLVQTAGQGVLGLVQMCAWDTLSPQWTPMSEGYTVPVLIWNSTGAIPPMPTSLGGIAGTVQWTVSGIDKYYAADVDGDGIQEIVAVQDSGLAVLKWAGSALYVLWSTTLVASNGDAGNWQPWSTDAYLPVSFCIGPLSSEQSLLAWNPDGAMAVLSWDGSGLQSVWSGNVIAGAGINTDWVIATIDDWWSCDLVGQGVDSIVLSRPGESMGVVQWDPDANALSLVWFAGLNLLGSDGSPAWPLQWNDQCAPAPLQVGAYYADSLVLFSPMTLMVAVAQWNAEQAQLQVVWATQEYMPQLPGGAAVQVNSGSVLTVAALQPYSPMVLFTQSGSIGCLYWDRTQLVGQWTQQVSTFPAVGGAPPWQCASDVYSVVAGPAPAQQQLLAQATSRGNYYGLLVYNPEGAMNCCWQSTQGLLPGWGLPLIASAPQSGYPPFNSVPGSVEAQMYAALSNQLESWPQNSDLRSQYTKTNSVQQLQSWIGQIQGMDLPPMPPLAPTNPQWPLDLGLWNDIRQSLVNELQNLAAVYGLYDNLVTLAAAIDTQMDADLTHVIGQVSPPSSGAPQVTFWLPNLVAALPAACPALSTQNPALGTGLALLVPLLPAAVLQGQLPTGQMDYTQVQAVVDTAFGNVSATKLNVLGQNQIAGDAIKSGVVAAMAQQGWAWPAPGSATDDVAADMAAATQNGNRVQFYATVIPAAYTIYYEQTSFPHLRGARWDNTPSYAAWTTTISGEPWCYTLATGDGMDAGFPSQPMMTEVLGLAQASDFFLGNGPWAGLRRASW